MEKVSLEPLYINQIHQLTQIIIYKEDQIIIVITLLKLNLQMKNQIRITIIKVLQAERKTSLG